MVITRAESRSQSTLAAGDEPRIEMRSGGAATGYVDGGWWPRSTDPAVEFPALVRALHGVVGQVGRVTYNLDFWEPVRRKVTVDGRVVRCEGFRTMNPHTVTAIGVNSQRVTLLVVPPATPDRVARAALRAAADHDSAATVEDILTGSGARSEVGAANPGTPSRSQATGAVPARRWKGDAGSSHREDHQAATDPRGATRARA